MAKITGLTFTNPSTRYDPHQHAYTHIVQFPGDWRIIMPAGQVAGKSSSMRQVNPEFRVQMREALENVGLVLESANASLKDVVKLVIYIVDYNEERFVIYREEMTRVWGSRYPAGTLIPVNALAIPGLLVEVDVTAAVPNQ